MKQTNKNYIRKTAIESVRSLLKNLPEHHAHPLDAIRMIDRSIGGLLAHKESPAYKGYREHASLIFPSGLEATSPGKDIILILNSKMIKINQHGTEHNIAIPSSLKNPEKGVAQIIGQHFARTLFTVRAQILEQIINTQPNGELWQPNATANMDALHVLKNYTPYPSIFDPKKQIGPSWKEQLLPCIFGR